MVGIKRKKVAKLTIPQQRKREWGHIVKPTFKRLARRGGVKRLGSEVQGDAKAALRKFLTTVISDAVTIMEGGRRKTVTRGDVIQALKRSGMTFYGYR